MATPLDYKPRHKKAHAFAGSTPRGPERWARALHNAWRRPNTKDAELIFGRLQVARQVAKWNSVREGTFAMLDFNRTSRFGEPLEGEWGVDYYCCSRFCAAMNIQLDMSLTHSSTVADVLKGVTRTSWRKVERRTPTRVVRCQFCGSRIKP